MKYVLMQNFSIKSNLFLVWAWVLQIKCKETENFRVKSTRSIRHVISITRSQHTQATKRRIKNFSDFMYFCFATTLQFLIYFSSFLDFIWKTFCLTVGIFIMISYFQCRFALGCAVGDNHQIVCLHTYGECECVCLATHFLCYTM